MASKTILTCDRCKAEMKPGNDGRINAVRFMRCHSGYSPYQETAFKAYELCPACADLVRAFASAPVIGAAPPGDYQKLEAALKDARRGLSRTEINRGVFGKKRTAQQISELLQVMESQGTARKVTDKSTGGRKTERWFHGSVPRYLPEWLVKIDAKKATAN